MAFDKAFELGVEAGADDVVDSGDEIEIFGPVEAFKTIMDTLGKAGVQPAEAGLRLIAKQEIELGVEDTLSVMKVVEYLEDLDDVQDVYHNVKMSDAVLAALENA
jgi:transcriptional/translational regulatory protein YebC/TACO1